MKLYGIKTALGYSLITTEKQKLDRYKNNILFPVVKLKYTKNDDGKYYMLTTKENDVIVTDNPIAYREYNEKYLESKTIKIDLEEC